METQIEQQQETRFKVGDTVTVTFLCTVSKVEEGYLSEWQTGRIVDTVWVQTAGDEEFMLQEDPDSGSPVGQLDGTEMRIVNLYDMDDKFVPALNCVAVAVKKSHVAQSTGSW